MRGGAAAATGGGRTRTKQKTSPGRENLNDFLVNDTVEQSN